MPARFKTSSAAVLLALAVVLAACGSDDSGKVSTDKNEYGPTGASDSTATTTPSAAGKPCVALADPLPEGAPEVPITVGPPPTELVVQDIKDGDGTEVVATSTVVADYIGVSCSTGVIFDDSYSRGEAAEFPLSGVIKGWQDGLVGMKVGGTRLLGIPSALGYGEAGQPPDISGGETLWFVVEMREVK